MCLSPIMIPIDKVTGRKWQQVPCGKCLECMRHATTEWALRIMLEALDYEQNSCITLTYNDAHLPEKSLLKPKDTQDWLKRLRKALSPVKVRFFLSGEYGSKRGRPHYHVILFGYDPPDKVYSFTKNGHKYYRSKFIQDTWSLYDEPIGNIIVTDLTYQGAFYSAKYLQKSLFEDMEVRPFIRMSNRPGIGFNSVYMSDVQTDKIYFEGRAYQIPRYFLKVLEREGVVLDDLKSSRRLSAANAYKFTTVQDLYLRQNRAENLLRDYLKKS